VALPEYHRQVRGGPVIILRDEEVIGGWIVLICDACGLERKPGDWPQCPHIPGKFGDDPIEPYFDEHITESGEMITTKGQRRSIMSRNKLEYRKKRTDLLTGQRIFFDMGRK
jgi:hypothetical protein